MNIKVNPDLLDTNAKQIQVSCTELSAIAGKLTTAMKSLDIEAQKIAPIRALLDQTTKMAADGAARGNELAKIMSTKAALFRQIDTDGASGIGGITGTIIGVPTSSTPKGLPPISQIQLNMLDNRWRNIDMNNKTKEDIDQVGCLLTVIAMVGRANGVPTDPAKVDAWMDKNGGYTNNGSYMSQKAQEKYLSEILHKKVSMSTPYTRNSTQNGMPNIRKNLETGVPVVLHVDAKTSDGHYILAVGLDKSGNYICIDPNGGKQITVSRTSTSIRSARVYN